MQVQSWLQVSNNTGILNTCIWLWLTESDSIKDVVRSSVKVPEFDKHLKKTGGHIGWNVVEITIKMKTIVRKPLMIKIAEVAIEKGAFWSPSTTVANFTYWMTCGCMCEWEREKYKPWLKVYLKFKNEFKVAFSLLKINKFETYFSYHYQLHKKWVIFGKTYLELVFKSILTAFLIVSKRHFTLNERLSLILSIISTKNK